MSASSTTRQEDTIKPGQEGESTKPGQQGDTSAAAAAGRLQRNESHGSDVFEPEPDALSENRSHSAASVASSSDMNKAQGAAAAAASSAGDDVRAGTNMSSQKQNVRWGKGIYE